MIFTEGKFFAQHIDTDWITIILMDVFSHSVCGSSNKWKRTEA